MPRPTQTGPAWTLQVDTATADAELQAGVRGAAPVDDLDGFGRRGQRFPVLSDTAQRELVVAYRNTCALGAALKDGEIPPRQRSAARREAGRRDEYLTMLTGSVFRLVRRIVEDRAPSGSLFRDPHTSADLLQEAYAIVVEAAASYDLGRGIPFHAWVGVKVRQQLGRVRSEIRSGPLPDSWWAVARVAARQRAEHVATQRAEASLPELKARVHAWFWAAAHARLDEAEQALPEAARNELVTNRLRKRGVLGAIGELDHVMLAAAPNLRLDAPVSADGEATHADLLCSPDDVEADAVAGVEGDTTTGLERLLFGSSSERDRAIALARGQHNPQDPRRRRRWASIAEEYEVEVTEARRIHRAAQVRACAPHAQYAYLTPDVTGQFETGPAEDVRFDELARRRAPAERR